LRRRSEDVAQGADLVRELDQLRALRRLVRLDDLQSFARRLAEPNLTALSGQTASFNAGGQVPVQTCEGSLADQTCSVTYKDFGVILNFTPTVLDDGLINLQLNPTVSEIDPSLSYNGNPGFVIRTANTSVELRDGQSFAIAGLLLDRAPCISRQIHDLACSPIV
jgi:pilus assembly protein CpaC